MHRFAHTALACAAALTTFAAQAQVQVQDAWVRATVPQQKSTGAFMRLQAAQDSRLVAVSTPLTPVAEVHEMAMQDNVMKMRAVPALELPAGKAVELKPGGYHLMLMDLPRQVKEGESVALTLMFEGKDGKRQNVEVQAPVRALTSAAPAADSHGGHGGHKH